MIATTRSGTLIGVESHPVRVEAHLACGLPAFHIVGLPEAAVRESRLRVKSAIANAGYELPPRRMTVNLAPADLRKGGTGFDLAIAVALVAAWIGIAAERLARFTLVAELSLDGRLRPVPGALPHALSSRREGAEGIVLAEADARVACAVEGLRVLSASHLSEVVEFVRGAADLGGPVAEAPGAASRAPAELDLGDVRGQAPARRALEVAAAGGHNLLLLGPPGSGKTMLARRLPTVLPPLSFEERLEASAVWSVAHPEALSAGLLAERPFRAPHHTASDVGLVGGGSPPRPGEVSLAHAGVLFLDELPEFRRSALEALRQPLEDGVVFVVRAGGRARFPSRTMLVAAMNPCPCGMAGTASGGCVCAPEAIRRYRARISEPLLDRIDLHVLMPAVPLRELSLPAAESSEAVRARVEAARERQRARFAGARGSGRRITCNAEVPASMLGDVCALGDDAQRLLERAAGAGRTSARSYERIRRVARTIADLAGEREVRSEHVAEAVGMRALDGRTY